jgi:hypothetical protein
MLFISHDGLGNSWCMPEKKRQSRASVAMDAVASSSSSSDLRPSSAECFRREEAAVREVGESPTWRVRNEE